MDLRQRQDGSRYAFVEFGDSGHVQEIMAAGPFTLDEQQVRTRRRVVLDPVDDTAALVGRFVCLL